VGTSFGVGAGFGPRNEITNHKHQMTNKSQYPKQKSQTGMRPPEGRLGDWGTRVEIWILGIGYYLGFVV
jgi:hypothetical protein